MRTTLNLDDELIKAAKIEAVRRGVSLTAMVEEGLRQALQGRSGNRGRVKLPVYSSMPRPGIDLTRTSELLDDEELLAHP
jgi:plasmid stability protein